MHDSTVPKMSNTDTEGEERVGSSPTPLVEQCRSVLANNDRDGQYTVPGAKLYPHQWLWDSCFIAIGLRHIDTKRAQAEILSLLRSQWSNGMLPNIIFNDEARYARDRNAWRSWLNPMSPDNVTTSGITQPPMLAEAIKRIGDSLSAGDRHAWYRQVLPALQAYHEWLYNERDPHDEGLVLQIHPWEVGMDNTPAWTEYLHQHQLPWWIRGLQKAHLIKFVELFRRDTQTIPVDERFETVEILTLFDTQRRLRRKSYNANTILNHSLFLIEDVAFNAIFIRANAILCDIAAELKHELPASLLKHIKQSKEAFNKLWDPETGQYYSRDFITHKLLKETSVGTLLSLYAGCINKDHAAKMVKLIENDQQYGTAYPLPSVAANSRHFQPMRYWQGPTWLNINWLVIDGLHRYGFDDHANALTELSLELVEKSGCAEYFDPITGEPLGADNFSWTAALALDLYKQIRH